jgi:Domain of unknown function (DUF5642)
MWQWTMIAGHTTASDRLADTPHVDGAETLDVVVDIKSTFEPDTEIDSRAYTFTAFLGNYGAFTALITDPRQRYRQCRCNLPLICSSKRCPRCAAEYWFG